MRVLLGNQRLNLRASSLLGVGGEARVYRHADQAIKIFHPVPPGDAAADRARRDKLAKVDALARLAPSLPGCVVAPTGVVTDEAGEPIGVAMPLVQDAEPIARIGQRAWRETHLDAAGVVRAIAAIGDALRALHATGVVVGDLNDGNVLLGANGPALIDVDSFQLGGFPCAVAHERFLDPRLYGVDLAARPAFAPEHDFYSLTVMLVMGLLFVHPYGGVHKRFATFLRRGEARHSIFRGDVSLPKSAAPLDALSDALLDHLACVFDRDARGALPSTLLTTRFTRCSGCGLEHARSACPACRVVAPMPAPVRTIGRATARMVFSTEGRILAAAIQLGRLRVVVRDASGVIVRESGAVVTERAPLHARVFPAGDDTHVVSTHHGRAEVATFRARGDSAYDVTGAVAGEPAFAANALEVARTEDDWLFVGGRRQGKILEGETWIRMGERLGAGLYRAGQVAVAFVFALDRPGLREVPLAGLAALGKARLLSVDVRFDAEHALFVIHAEIGGSPRTFVALVDARGRILAEAFGAPEDGALFGPARAKALMGGVIVCASDEGLVAVRADSGRFVPGAVFEDTAAFVTAESELLAGPGGAVLIVGAQTIHELRRAAP